MLLFMSLNYVIERRVSPSHVSPSSVVCVFAIRHDCRPVVPTARFDSLAWEPRDKLRFVYNGVHKAAWRRFGSSMSAAAPTVPGLHSRTGSIHHIPNIPLV